MSCLVLMEVSKKQNYIFRSNKMAENIGASIIIDYVTNGLGRKELPRYSGKIIMEGGGKSLYEFSDKNIAIEFNKNLSFQILEKYDGLDLKIVTLEVDYEKDNLVEKIEELYLKLGKKKGNILGKTYQKGLGIEKICSSTGNPGSSYNKHYGDAPISKETLNKLEFNKKIGFKGFIEDSNIEFSNKNDDFKADDKSYIAIVHLDGNKMGEKFTKLNNYFRNKKGNISDINKEYLKAFKGLSESIDKIYKNAFEKIAAISCEKDNVAQIRPVILAGDDVTFIAKANKAIKLSKMFIDEIEKSKVKIANEEIKLTACVGIAFVKSTYPFYRGYKLAEELCENCKILLKKEKLNYSMIDWHLLQGETDKNIMQIRKDEYIKDGLKLTMKPLFINVEKDFNYEDFKDTLKKINGKDPSVKLSKNKIKGLREKISIGKVVGENYISFYKLENELNFIRNTKIINGIKNSTFVFFDAIELMDLVEEI